MRKTTMIIKTNLTRNYVPDWTVLDAMRELIQNAIDSDPEHFSLDWDHNTDTVTITTNTALPLSSLYMGESSKRDDTTKLGVHGEGLKLALLILLREERNPYIASSSSVQPKFELLEWDEFDFAEDLTITKSIETMVFEVYPQNYSDKTVITFTANYSEWMSLETIVLPKDTPYGLLANHEAGALYLGGLRIADVGMHYAYNLAPGSIQLERDRRVADIFKVQEACSQIWLNTERWDDIAEGMLKGYSDFDGLPALEVDERLVDACVKRAKEFGKPPMSYSMSSARHEGRYVPESFYSVYSRSSRAIKPAVRKQPADILAEWFHTNRSYFRKAGAARMAELIKEAKSWQR